MTIADNLKTIKAGIPQDVKLIAVSKTKPNEDILEAYKSGHRAFGENRVQELAEKFQELPKDIEWHLIGHLQKNKVKYIAPFVYLIHAVDSFDLLKVIDKEAKKNNRIIPCLLQIHIAEEETKFGMNENELICLLENSEFKEFKNISIYGLMGMATFTSDMEQVRKEFSYLKSLFEKVKKEFPELTYFSELSMGMSSDYKIAIENGATMIRVGSEIFGARIKY